MRHAVEMAPGDMMYMYMYIKIGSGIQKLMRGWGTQTAL
jgi:hypothetical protein